MHGNVWEFCQDWFGGYSSKFEIDPKGPDNGRYRVIRGGSWDWLAPAMRSAFRGAYDHDLRDDGDIGFRVARDL